MVPPMPKVYIVDDDVSVRESLESLVQSAGWQPHTFESADEFLEHPRELCPNCLLLDLSLPGLTGLDLQKRIADRTETPIIFISGHGDVPKTVEAMKAGAVEFLTKPLNDQVLLSAPSCKAVEPQRGSHFLKSPRSGRYVTDSIRSAHASGTSWILL